MSSMGAISGLLISNDYIDVISNNIANASTIGYKSRTPVFVDIFSPLCCSNNNNGHGVGISNIMQNFDNGMLIETGRNLDLGISETGFFRVLDAQGHTHYTRNGQFLVDDNKNIVNMQGMYLTGINKPHLNNTVYHPSSLEPINLQHASLLKAKPTSEITLKAILKRDPNSSIKTDIIDDSIPTSEDYNSSINILNKDGKKEPINILFKKKDKHSWKVIVDLEKSSDPSVKEVTKRSFDIEFNSDGELISNTVFDLQSKNSKHENIILNLTGSIEQSDQDHNFDEYVQNGYSQGVLKTFNIASNGEIIGKYSNLEQKSIGQILLSNFVNPEKLQPESGNVWSANSQSGAENIGTAGDTGFGFVLEKKLEASNVDLNKELINMIIAQRNYQSNAQSFKTEDKIINTLINLR